MIVRDRITSALPGAFQVTPPQHRIDGCTLGPESSTQVELGDLRLGLGLQKNRGTRLRCTEEEGVPAPSPECPRIFLHHVTISQVIPGYVMCVEGNGDPLANMQYLGGVITTKQRPAAKITAYCRISDSEAWF